LTAKVAWAREVLWDFARPVREAEPMQQTPGLPNPFLLIFLTETI